MGWAAHSWGPAARVGAELCPWQRFLRAPGTHSGAHVTPPVCVLPAGGRELGFRGFREGVGKQGDFSQQDRVRTAPQLLGAAAEVLLLVAGRERGHTRAVARAARVISSN